MYWKKVTTEDCKCTIFIKQILKTNNKMTRIKTIVIPIPLVTLLITYEKLHIN